MTQITGSGYSVAPGYEVTGEMWLRLHWNADKIMISISEGEDVKDFGENRRPENSITLGTKAASDVLDSLTKFLKANELLR
jgi:hypothetical protein